MWLIACFLSLGLSLFRPFVFLFVCVLFWNSKVEMKGCSTAQRMVAGKLVQWHSASWQRLGKAAAIMDDSTTALCVCLYIYMYECV